MKKLLFSLFSVLALAANSFADMAPADVTATTTGISDALTLFYTIGGAILVVMASIWGFHKIASLLGHDPVDDDYSEYRDHDSQGHT